LALPQAGAHFRYRSVILGMSHYLGVTPIFVFLWAQIKRIHCKEEHKKTNTNFTTQEGEKTNQTRRRRTQQNKQ